MKKNTISYQLNKVRVKSSAIVYFANLHTHSYSPFQFSARGDEVSEIMGDDHGPTIQFDAPQLVNLSVLLVPYPASTHDRWVGQVHPQHEPADSVRKLKYNKQQPSTITKLS